jgi:histidine triad (HIT) family protein
VSMSTIFKKIIDKQIPAQIVFEDELCLAFKDVDPKAPTHILLIPKKEVASLNELQPADRDLLGHMMLLVPRIAKEQGLHEGYRTVCNTGKNGGQSVFHLHIHILGGRALSWPPG